MTEVSFSDAAWQDYLYWQGQDKRTLRRINRLIADISRNGHDGIGSPEPLGGNLAGYWSRRIDQANRIVYQLRDGGGVILHELRTHYGDH